jgi:uncharacterized protein
MKRYLEEMSSCMDEFWSAEFAATQLFFTPPERQFVQKNRYKACDTVMNRNLMYLHCNTIVKYYMAIPPDYVIPENTAWATLAVAHVYAFHILYASSITAYTRRTYDNGRAAARDTWRRESLQAECFAGVAISSLGAAVPPLAAYREMVPTASDADWDEGRPATQWRWFEKGYRAGKPGACNTWTSPKKAVT